MICFTHAVDNIHVCWASNLYFIRLISVFFFLIHSPHHLQSPHVQSLKFSNVWHSICGKIIYRYSKPLGEMHLYITKKEQCEVWPMNLSIEAKLILIYIWPEEEFQPSAFSNRMKIKSIFVQKKIIFVDVNSFSILLCDCVEV